jgi:hypothetical protein
MEFGQTDFRLANRPEGVYVESPPFLYTGTNNTPLYAKLTLTFGSGIGYDNSLTIGPTWVEVEAVGSGGGSVVQSYVMLKGGSTNLTTQFADAGWRDVSVPNTLMSSGSGITAAGNVVTVAQAGLYIVSAGVLMGSGGTNRRIVAVESFVAETLGNGVPLVRSEMGGLAGMFPTFALSGDVYLAAGTKIRLIGYQNQGGGTALAQRDDMQSAYFNVRKVV